MLIHPNYSWFQFYISFSVLCGVLLLMMFSWYLQAFMKLDSGRRGVITLQDMRKFYNSHKHPHVRTGIVIYGNPYIFKHSNMMLRACFIYLSYHCLSNYIYLRRKDCYIWCPDKCLEGNTLRSTCKYVKTGGLLLSSQQLFVLFIHCINNTVHPCT